VKLTSHNSCKTLTDHLQTFTQSYRFSSHTGCARFVSWWPHVRYVVDEVTLEQVSLQDCSVFCQSQFHQCFIFTYHCPQRWQCWPGNTSSQHQSVSRGLYLWPGTWLVTFKHMLWLTEMHVYPFSTPDGTVMMRTVPDMGNLQLLNHSWCLILLIFTAKIMCWMEIVLNQRALSMIAPEPSCSDKSRNNPHHLILCIKHSHTHHCSQVLHLKAFVFPPCLLVTSVWE
jgi:hypothetical protein